ncbi:MAG: metal-sensitive transcriptional regulator [Phycisphaerae bacterium]
MPKNVKSRNPSPRQSGQHGRAPDPTGRPLPILRRFGPGGNAFAVDADKKKANLHRLKRIEGQIRGVHDMVQQNRYCADILIQIAAAQKSLSGVARQLLANHLKHCVAHEIRAGGAQADTACDELLKLISHLDH